MVNKNLIVITKYFFQFLIYLKKINLPVVRDPRLAGESIPSIANETVIPTIPINCIPVPIRLTNSSEYLGGRNTSP